MSAAEKAFPAALYIKLLCAARRMGYNGHNLQKGAARTPEGTPPERRTYE